jgi:rubrerythrin
VTDSALRELDGDPSSRKRFLKMLGAAGAAGALLAACGDDGNNDVTKTTDDNAGDLRIVTYVLTLEYLAAAFYQDVLDSGVITDKRIGDLLTSIQQDEQEHVDALEATATSLGGTPAGRPRTSFQDVIGKGAESILQTAATVENLGAAAYLGQVRTIRSKDILAEALSIHSVEARHAAALNDLAGRGLGDGKDRLAGSLPDGPFARPMDMAAVLKAVEPFIAG